ncbi:MAG: hypothetical protein QOF54_281 [Solirubrobacteraceae bacterium]|nr:hypothetical protein [Solirubrobacteraceae bacterium]
MTKEPAIGSYRDADRAWHELVVRETADGGWHVLDLDLDGDTAHVVDALEGGEDGRPQAEAIARDYLSTVAAMEPETGRAPGDPISEQGGSDDRIHRRPRPGPRTRQARGTALPRAAR